MKMSKSAESIIKANLVMNAGKQKAAAAKDKAEKAKALKSGGKKSSSRGGAKSRAVGKARKAAGKVAAGRAGFGCRVSVHKNGGDINGALNYIEIDKKNHEIIYSTCGREREQIEQTFEALEKLRPDIDNNVGHFSISLAHNSGFDETKWPELVEYAMRELDINPDNHAAIAVIHNDKDPSIRDLHIHCVFSRIGYDSTCHDGNKLGYYSSAVAEKIEKEFNLNLTPRDDESIGRKAPSISQLKEFERTGKLPKMVELQNAIDIALATNPKNYDELKKALKPLKVDVHLNEQTKDDKPYLASIVYAKDNFFMPASKLGSKYTKYGLEKSKGVLYEPSRQIENSSNNEADGAIAGHDKSTKDSELSNNRGNGAKPTAIGNSNEQPSREQRGSDEQAVGGDGRSFDFARPNAEDSNRPESRGENKQFENDSNLGVINADFESATFRIGAIAETTSANTERRSDPRSRKDYTKSYAYQRATEQIKALGVQDVEISIMLPAKDLLKPKDRKMLKRTLSVENFHDNFGFFMSQNLQGAEIYVQPDPKKDHGLVLLDDLEWSSIEDMKADGVEPCAIVETSPNNWQTWVRISDKPLPKEVRKLVSATLTEKYDADVGAIGSQRIGRLAGFTNRKEKHLNKDGKSPYCKLVETRAGACTSGNTLVAEAQNKIATDERVAKINASVPAHQYSQNANIYFKAQAKKIMQQYPDTDFSRLDFMCAKDLAYQGFSDAQIATAMQDESPSLDARKSGHETDYVNRTIAAARTKLAEERNKATKDEALNNTASDAHTI